MSGSKADSHWSGACPGNDPPYAGSWASQVVLVVKSLPANAGDMTQVQPLGQEDTLREGMVTQSSILAWRTPMDRGAWRASLSGHKKLGHMHVGSLSLLGTRQPGPH